MSNETTELLNREQELIRRMHALLRRIWQMDKDWRILKASPSCRESLEELLNEIERP